MERVLSYSSRVVSFFLFFFVLCCATVGCGETASLMTTSLLQVLWCTKSLPFLLRNKPTSRFVEQAKKTKRCKAALSLEYPEKYGGGRREARPKFEIRGLLSSSPPLLLDAFGAYTIILFQAKPPPAFSQLRLFGCCVFHRHLHKHSMVIMHTLPFFERTSLATSRFPPSPTSVPS
jgi:hypothetical protein